MAQELRKQLTSYFAP